MRVFVDSADQKQIAYWLEEGVVDGVTTNPSIMFKDAGTDFEDCARRLAAMLGEKPLSVEVTSNDRKVMVEQARTFATWARNIVVKIPIVNEHGESCLGVMHRLSQEGIGVNATAILSFNKAMLAAKAGATYVSIFAGRVADEGNDPSVTIRNVRTWLDDWSFTATLYHLFDRLGFSALHAVIAPFIVIAETNPASINSIKTGASPTLMTCPPIPQTMARFRLRASWIAAHNLCSSRPAKMSGKQSRSLRRPAPRGTGFAKSAVVILLFRDASGYVRTRPSGMGRIE